MHGKFLLNACVRIKSIKGNPFEFCEVGAIVDANFIVNLNALYSEILLQCVKTLGTAKLNIVSIKLMPEQKKVKITANVLLAADEDKVVPREEDKYRKIEFIEGNGKIQTMGIYRLFKYMEALAMKEKQAEFDSLVHVRVIPTDSDDMPVSKF
ncbi:MAG: hypothetical protein A2Y67_03100 [Candidatus Buchananbacteria bacterium RBG_13_39_9]|uniref:Uncharacterized protein n=1 Tax=Candidatus Buchananbacteria bacterium RBG_13_39_9 TaxID=1797531 RepID=A0A1G1XPM8_9BACT|nr:MAG: hypothetical protein A2Y67_03100 [Candidatus Buchananbacteria bacterium RBG_13_39_9]